MKDFLVNWNNKELIPSVIRFENSDQAKQYANDHGKISWVFDMEYNLIYKCGNEDWERVPYSGNPYIKAININK